MRTKQNVMSRFLLIALSGLLIICASYSNAEITPCITEPGDFNDGVDGPYSDNRDGTVIDNGTQLMWQQSDDGEEYDWDHAVQYCKNLNLAGCSDWKMPFIFELSSLLDQNYSPAINPFYFPGCNSSGYWSQDMVPQSPNYYWYADFGSTYVGGAYGLYANYIRCVRLVGLPCNDNNDDLCKKLPTRQITTYLETEREISSGPIMFKNNTFTLNFPKYCSPVDIYIALFNVEGNCIFLKSSKKLSYDFHPFATRETRTVSQTISVANSDLIHKTRGNLIVYWMIVPSNGGNSSTLTLEAYELGGYAIFGYQPF